MIVIAYIAYIFWAVLGLFFWLPLLFRVVAGFCGTLVYNMIVNNPNNIKNSKISLDLAVSFYAKGFQMIHSTLYEKQNTSNVSESKDFHFMSFFGQILWTILFWSITISPLTKFSVLNYIKTIGYSSTKYIEESEKYLSVHDTTTAINMMSGAIDREKFNADFYFKRGMLYYKTSNFVNATEDLESAIKLDSIKYGRNAEITWIVGKIFSFELEENEKAIKYFTATIKLSPNYADAYFQRGYCYHNIDEKDLALQDYNSTIMLEPNFSSGIAYNNKALILIDKGLKDEACILFESAIKKGYSKAKENKNKYCK